MKRNKSLISNRLTRFSNFTSNNHVTSVNENFKSKCEDIIEKIEDKCYHNERDYDKQKKVLKKMKNLWNTKMNKEP